MRVVVYILIFMSFFSVVSARESDGCELMRDLLIVDEINHRGVKHFPVTYNHYLQGGYINMPSARMGRSGEVGVGYAYVPPYRVYNARFQPFDNMEFTGNYRVFSGILDPVFGSMGFGDFSDKGVNLKVAIMRPEDFEYKMPGIAVGWDDFLGTKSFNAKYIVATQVFPEYDFEMSIGFGRTRIRGIFGGFLWSPFRRCGGKYFKGLSFNAEWDRTDYSKDPHPKGRSYNTRLNVGLKWRLFDYFDFSASYVRGKEWAFSGSAHYNFGEMCGFLPKIDNPLPYTSPRNHEPVGIYRPEQILVSELYCALCCQGFDLLKVQSGLDRCCRNTLYLTLFNRKWRSMYEIRSRLNDLLSSLVPSNYTQIVVIIESEGFPVQQYVYHTDFLREFSESKMGHCELNLLTPMCEAKCINPFTTHTLFQKKLPRYCYTLRPDFQAFFGSAKGKFKYSLGVNAEFEGFLCYNVLYDISITYPIAATLNDINSVDILNPSQIINVHTDLVRYLKKKTFRFERAYLQKSWNLGRGCYGRVASGLFEEMYGGSVVECLWYPVNSCVAIGLEGALLRKRTLTGVGFSDKVRKLQGFKACFQKFQGLQYFLDVYYDYEKLMMDLKISVGQFMAKDKGARFETGKYFSSGLRVYFWYTLTNANDRINGQRYYDKGVGFSMPLDIFYTCSSRQTWGHSMSAWLRDTGYRADTGRRLYEMIHNERLRTN